jgi:hypothetical protein
MANTVLVHKIDVVHVTGMIPGLHKVQVKATQTTGATNSRLVPMPSDDAKTLRLGFYVDADMTEPVITVKAELEFTGFLKVFVKGETNEICEAVPQ